VILVRYSIPAKLPFLYDDLNVLNVLVEIMTGRHGVALHSIGEATGENGSESWHDATTFTIAHEQETMWRERERELMWYLDRAVLVQPTTDIERVANGHMVRVRYGHTGDEEDVFVSSYIRMMPVKRSIEDLVVLSTSSGTGQAILGQTVGQTLPVEVRARAAKRWATEVGPRPGPVQRTFDVTILGIWLPAIRPTYQNAAAS
jgi:transcription elongation GreA/GreB family factor